MSHIKQIETNCIWGTGGARPKIYGKVKILQAGQGASMGQESPPDGLLSRRYRPLERLLSGYDVVRLLTLSGRSSKT
jgi:hypothetical protein